MEKDLKKILLFLLSTSLVFNNNLNVFAAENLENRPEIIYRISENIKENIIAIPNIYNNTGMKDSNYISTALTDSLISRLVEKSNNKFSVVERTRFESLIKEIGVQRSGLMDISTITKAGNLIGASQVITGSISQISNFFRLNLRVVDVKTGKIVSAFTEDVKSETEIFFLVDRISDRVAASLRKDLLQKEEIIIPNFTQQEKVETITINESGTSPHIWLSSIFIPGLGQIILGETTKGVLIILSEILLTFLTYYTLDTYRSSALGFSSLAVQILLYSYNIFDSYNINQDKSKNNPKVSQLDEILAQQNKTAPNNVSVSYNFKF